MLTDLHLALGTILFWTLFWYACNSFPSLDDLWGIVTNSQEPKIYIYYTYLLAFYEFIKMHFSLLEYHFGQNRRLNVVPIFFDTGLEKLAQKGKSLSSLAVITGISLFLILVMVFLFVWKRYQPHKGM